MALTESERTDLQPPPTALIPQPLLPTCRRSSSLRRRGYFVMRDGVGGGGGVDRFVSLFQSKLGHRDAFL